MSTSPKKFKSAKEKQAYLDHQAWLASHSVSTKKQKKKVEPLKYSLGTTPRDVSSVKAAKSHDCVLDMHATIKKPVLQYTGNAVVGIATTHKSNAVPVFSKQEAIEVSTMRRG